MQENRKFLVLLAALSGSIGALIGMDMTALLGLMETYIVLIPVIVVLWIALISSLKPTGSLVERLVAAMGLAGSDSLEAATTRLILEAAIDVGEEPRSMDELFERLNSSTLEPRFRDWQWLPVSKIARDLRGVKLRCKALPERVVAEIFKAPKQRSGQK